WELHIAGGMEVEGYWLDAHSGAVPDDLVEQTRRLLPRLPNLQAVVFEIFPSFLPGVGLDAVAEQLRALKRLRQEMGPPVRVGDRRRLASASPLRDGGGASPVEWEAVLGALAIETEPPASELVDELAADPGLEIIRRLIAEFRASMLVSAVRLTSRL